VALTSDKPGSVDTDLLFVPAFEGESLAGVVEGLDEASGGAVRDAAERGEFRGRVFELFLTPVTGWKAPRVAIVGAGKASEFDTDRLRKVATAAALAARTRRVKRMAFLTRGGGEPAAAVQAIAEGLMLAAFTGDVYKSGERSAPPLEQALVASGQGHDAALGAAVERGRVLGESCNLARDLCNEPANVLTPSLFADRGATIGREAGLHVEVLDEDEIARLQMGLLLGVARGSAEPPRVLVLRHTAPGGGDRPVLGLVGKGITFDTGGISIKPAEGMDRMKDDMAGGAAVIGAMRAISLLKAPIDVIGIVPMTENMPGGRALKPGDVITGAGGKSVEVLNTDAEGRLILGDGPETAAGRCRCSTTTASRSRARSPTWSTWAGARPGRAPRRCSSVSSSASCPGSTSTSPEPRGRMRPSRGCRRARPGLASARWRSSPSPAASGAESQPTESGRNSDRRAGV
jgi:leucyl aminopeptidase